MSGVYWSCGVQVSSHFFMTNSYIASTAIPLHCYRLLVLSSRRWTTSSLLHLDAPWKCTGSWWCAGKYINWHTALPHLPVQEMVQIMLCHFLLCDQFCPPYRSFDHHERPSFEALEELLKKEDSDLLKVASTTAASDETCSAWQAEWQRWLISLPFLPSLEGPTHYFTYSIGVQDTPSSFLHKHNPTTRHYLLCAKLKWILIHWNDFCTLWHYSALPIISWCISTVFFHLMTYIFTRACMQATGALCTY